MNIVKMTAPDYFVGKWINKARAFKEVAELYLKQPSDNQSEFYKFCLKLIPKYTMVQPKRLLALKRMLIDLDKREVAGDVVECGVWNGGSCALMATVTDRKIWMFDSFEGLPKPGAKDGARERKYHFEGWNKGAQDYVKEIFDELKIPKNRYEIVPGWFDKTLESSPVNPIALLHVDADWYDSVKIILEKFYDRVPVGGYVVLDDYGAFEGCRNAFRDFCKERGIPMPVLTQADWTGHYFKKS